MLITTLKCWKRPRSRLRSLSCSCTIEVGLFRQFSAAWGGKQLAITPFSTSNGERSGSRATALNAFYPPH
jgi:hypothetical protein